MLITFCTFPFLSQFSVEALLLVSSREGHPGTRSLGSVPSISLSIHSPNRSSLWWTSILVARLEPLLGMAPSSLEWDLDREWELDLDLDRDDLLLSEENEASDEESLGSSPMKTGLKWQKYFLWPLRARTCPL